MDNREQTASDSISKGSDPDELQQRLEALEGTFAALQLTQRELSASEHRFRAIVQNTGDAVVTLDSSGKVTFWNDAAERMFGYTAAEMAGQTLGRLMSESLRARHFRGLARVVATGESELDGHPIEVVGLRKSGVEFPVELTVSKWRAGSTWNFSGIMRDITERKSHEHSLIQQALHDPLTGLPNRILLFDRLRQEIARAKRNSQQVALLYLDLDGFKRSNDALGHQAGDVILAEVASRLLGCVRQSDSLARLGGDEFAILLPQQRGRDDAATVADRLLAAVAQPIVVKGKKETVGASIGGAFFPDNAKDEGTLVGVADTAMYRAKRAGKGRVVFAGKA